MLYIYLDESGDLGFNNKGSKYFTIAFIVIKNRFLLKRVVRKTKIKFNIPFEVELKGHSIRKRIKEHLLTKIQKLDVEIHAITVKKQNVAEYLQKLPNILYNYMTGLSLVERIVQEPQDSEIEIIVDKRVISVGHALNFNQYLLYQVLIPKNRPDIQLKISHVDSKKVYSIQAIDIICNAIFRKYERRDYSLFNIIKNKIITERPLFF